MKTSWRQVGIVARLTACLSALAVAAATAAAPPLDAEAEAGQAYQQALAALQGGQWTEAELLLERCLMLDPEHAVARLELAGLLAQRGRLEAAQALIDSLIDDPRTPQSHRERLLVLRASALRRLEAAALPEAPRAAWTAEIFVSWSRNPLARSDARELTLTLPEGNVTLPVTQNVRPAGMVGLALQRSIPGGLLVDVSAQHVLGQEHRQASRLALVGPLAELSVQDEMEPLQTSWTLQSRRGFDEVDRHSVGLVLRRQRWRLTAMGFVEPKLAREGQQVLAEYVVVQQPEWQILARAEAEHAARAYPGYARLDLEGGWAFAPHWLALAQASAQRDLRSYSAWLENGAPRHMQTAYLALERRWQPASQPWQLAVRAHLGQRWSNISLFDYRDAGLQLSWRHHW